MVFFPPCKINLGLDILSKREDGYHNLETLMYQVPFCDVLEVVKSTDFQFTSSGREIPPSTHGNLVVRAYRLMEEKYAIDPVHIHLHKIIPMGAGLGGGSSNASYTLLALNQIFHLNLDTKTLQELALQLGSDCPLFIEKEPQLARGRGEILTKTAVNLSGKFLKIVNLGIHVSTQQAFSNIDPKPAQYPISETILGPISTWQEKLKNDFEASIFPVFPALKQAKEKLLSEGALYSAMTGSGSSLFALYELKPALSFTLNTSQEAFEKIIEL